MRPRCLCILPTQEGRSVQSLLAHELAMSSSHISRLKRRENGILLNGTPVYTTARVHAGDRLCAAISDPPGTPRPEPLPIPLSIVFEDEYLLIIDKPSGLSVHASTRHPGEATLENALAAYLPPACGMHPVSRLDKGTSGLMTIAKSGYVHELIKRLLHTEALQKSYVALTVGAPLPRAGRIDAPLGYAAGSRYKMAVTGDGAASATRYETLIEQGGLALVRLWPETGRTHQIRVHMAHIGHPLLGDWLYGAEDARIARPALHADRLVFTHPLTGETLTLSAPLPTDMKQLVIAMESR